MNTTLRTSTRSMKNAGWLAVAGLVGAAIVAPAGVAASRPLPDNKVTICHATASDTSPYVQNEVDIASTGHLQGGHDTQHEGDTWNADMKANHETWGDIIPPYAYGDFSYAGQNWTAAGIEIYQDDCAIRAAEIEELTSTPGATETLEATETPAPTETPAETDIPEATETLAPAETPSGEVEGETGVPSSDPTGGVEGETGVPSSDPTGGVEGVTGTPNATLPSTDTISGTAGSAPANGTLRLILIAMAGILGAMLIVGREPAARRR